MRAIRFHEHGGPEQLRYGEVPDPVCGPEDVVIRIKAAALNGFEPMILGKTTALKTPLPMIPGGDGCGEIVAVGARVEGWRVGDRVGFHPFVPGEGMTGETRPGTCCELVRVPADRLIRLPEELGFEAAAALPIAYGTALRMMTGRGAVRSGDRVLLLGATEHGLVLGAEDDGVFAMRLSDYRRQASTVSDRLCHGLIQLAVAAWCFPTAQYLEERDSVVGVRLSVHRMVDYLIDLCRRLEESAGDHDPEAASPELAEAWRTILARAQTRATSDGRRAANTLAGMVAHALEALEEGGLLRRLGDEEGGTYQALGSYRIQVREMAALPAFQLVHGAAARAPREEG